MIHLWIGTSGFQYPEWKGGFYPETLPAAKMLPYYAERFPSTEVNYSFRRIPSEKTLEKWAAATPDRFKFSFKAPQKITHFAKLRACAETAAYFAGVLGQLERKLGAVLFQLPATFEKDAPLLADFLAGLPRGVPSAWEFRHASWFDDEIFSTLRSHGAALCLAESEELVTPRETTADFGYLRLRQPGYSAADLQSWADFIRGNEKRWTETFVYFKHEETGTGPKFARQLSERLGGE